MATAIKKGAGFFPENGRVQQPEGYYGSTLDTPIKSEHDILLIHIVSREQMQLSSLLSNNVNQNPATAMRAKFTTAEGRTPMARTTITVMASAKLNPLDVESCTVSLGSFMYMYITILR